MHRSRDYDHYHSSSSSDDSSHMSDKYHHRWWNEREVSSRYDNYSDSPERRNSRDVKRRSMEDHDISPQRSRHYRNAHCDAVSHDNGQGEKPKANRTRDNLDRSHSRHNRRDRSISPRHDYRGDDYSSETPLRGECDRHQYDSKGDRYESSPRRSNRPHYESPSRYRDDYYYDSHYNSPLRDRDFYHYCDYPSDHDHSPPRRGRRYESSPHSYRDDYDCDRNESPIRRWGDDRESHSPRYRNKHRSPSPSEERRRGEEYRRDPRENHFMIQGCEDGILVSLHLFVVLDHDMKSGRMTGIVGIFLANHFLILPGRMLPPLHPSVTQKGRVKAKGSLPLEDRFLILTGGTLPLLRPSILE
ncbi:uncharacterized protein LOC121431298 [Lytechinus variegatus]|uniref:uncharacterized protein LOC121431298 n=1 Tax=Lytechinus variegatus TaxID=7654 RepID=UPI001BB223DD|nr:uncharacterized protein LOC121431298 [Lytechinus variegatus]